MGIVQRIISGIRGFFRKMVPYTSVEQAENIKTSISPEMHSALEEWYDMYMGQAYWLNGEAGVKSMNLPVFISSEIARQITLEMKWNISGKKSGNDEDDSDAMNPRAEFLKNEFGKLVDVLRMKLEQGCASGGMLIKPYPRDGHIYFDWSMDWSIYPIAFDDDGNLSDLIIPDYYQIEDTYYTRLERHTYRDHRVHITQKAYKSQTKETLGKEIDLSEVPLWEGLTPEADVDNVDGPLFGWFKVASANCVDTDSPLGVSVFAKATPLIREADIQYSRLLWEYEGSELAIYVDPMALKPKSVQTSTGEPVMETPKLSERLHRALDIQTAGGGDLYNVFSPPIRDSSLLSGLNQLLIRVEDLAGLSRGSLSDANTVARTATELKIIRQRSYVTVADNQKALERCLLDVIRAMDKYATVYKLAPEGEYDVSFEWDDSIITDMEQETNERMILVNAGMMGKVEFRMYYLGETRAQAEEAIRRVNEERLAEAQMMQMLMPGITDGGFSEGPTDGNGGGNGIPNPRPPKNPNATNSVPKGAQGVRHA